MYTINKYKLIKEAENKQERINTKEIEKRERERITKIF